jgi:hypothetical protein
MISDNVSFKEGTFSATATRLGINNVPDKEALMNMQIIAKKIFQPLRVYVGGPIKINSFYRSPKLNKAIGGSTRSQHCKGCAIDIDDVHGFKTNNQMYHWIKDNLNFDQLIWEFGDDDNPDWVHISYVNDKDNRNRRLRAERINGKTTYRII